MNTDGIRLIDIAMKRVAIETGKVVHVGINMITKDNVCKDSGLDFSLPRKETVFVFEVKIGDDQPFLTTTAEEVVAILRHAIPKSVGEVVDNLEECWKNAAQEFAKKMALRKGDK